MPEITDIQSILDDYIIPWGIKIAIALAILIIGFKLAKWITRIVKSLMTKAKVDVMVVNFLGSIVYWMLLLFVAVIALDQLNVDTTAFIALFGAAGLAIGLALQDSLKNLAAGVMLVIFRPFTMGDVVEVGGLIGKVEKIGIFSTTMKTGDNREIIIPNGSIFSDTITNISARDTRRVDMVFGIGYDDDIAKAKSVIKQILDDDPRVLDDPEPLIAVAELADSSVNINVRPWTATDDYWSVFYDTQEKVKIAFDENGITIPYPQMQMHGGSSS